MIDMKNIKRKITSIVLSFTVTLQIFMGTGVFSFVAFGDTVNADGSITKTATAEYYECDDGWEEDCSGGGTRACSGGSTTTYHTTDTCGCGALLLQDIYETYCDECGARLSAYSIGIGSFECSGCGEAGHISDTRAADQPHGTVSYTCSHGYTSAHTIDHSCSHGYTYSHDVFDRYYNAAYGYSSTSSSTFKVWPITVVGENGLSASVSVSGATATDAVISGKSVSLTITGASAGTPIKVTNSGTGTEQTITMGASSGTYSFAMPAAVTTVTVALPCSTTASAITYGQSLNDSILTAVNSPYAGHWKWDDPDIMPSVSDSGVTAYAISYIPDDVGNAVINSTTTLTVNKYVPVISADDIAVSDITYGDTLADSSITCSLPQLNGADIAGSFTWENDATAPNAGTPSYNIVFTPNDTDNIEAISVLKVITVNKAPIVISDEIRQTVSATGITYGQALANSVLLGNVPQAGHYEWKYPDTLPTVADSNTTPFDVIFVPDDSNYASADLTCKLAVGERVYVPSDITDVRASDLIYGQSLASSIITGNAPVSGSFSWLNDSVVPTVNGANNYSVKFTPDDTSNYAEVIIDNVHVNVSKADAVLTAEQLASITTTPITYGQTLSDSIIQADSNIQGRFEWTNGSIVPTVADSEVTLYDITFIPNDTDNYNSITVQKTVKVNPASIVISDDIKQTIAATGITYGQTLASSVLSGNVPMAGHYEWKYPDTAPIVADSNTTPFAVVFVPDDSNYANADLTCTLSVSKKVLVQSDITDVQATGLTYGQSLASSIITGNAPVSGRFEWLDDSIVPTVNGTNNYSAKFIPDDANNCSEVIIDNVHVNVSKADPILTIEQLASIVTTPITYGQTLSASTISATEAVPGTFAWTNGDILPTVADSEVTPYDVTFTPNDINNYNTLALSAMVKVNKASIIIGDEIKQTIAAAGIVYEQTLADSVLSGDVPIAGHYEWKYPDTAPTVADSNVTPYDVVFVPDDTANYNNAELTCTLSVSKKAFVFTSDNNIAASDLIYGQPLSDSDITGIMPVPGRFEWVTPNTVPTVESANNYSVKFIPNDTDNYAEVIIDDVHVNVSKANPVITDEQLASIATTPITYGQSLSDSAIRYDATINGTFVWTDGTIMPTVADSEVTPYDITFIPIDKSNYNTRAFTATVKVNKATPVMPSDITTSISASDIVFGQTLASSSLSYAGTGTVLGTFSWVNPEARPVMADSDITEYPVLFTPDDTANYVNLNYYTTVHVNKAQAPDEYQNLTEMIAVQLGSENSFDIANILHIPEWAITGFNVIDNDGLFAVMPVIENNAAAFTIKNDNALFNKSAQIVVTVSSRDYLDFDATLEIVASNCKHDDLSYGVGRYSATCYSEGYTGNTVCNICHCTIKFGTTMPVKDHWETTSNDVPATCTSKGFSGDVFCFICGEFLEHGHETEMLPHTEGTPVVDVPATKTSTGIQTYYCVDCGAFIRSEIIPKLVPVEPEIHEHHYSGDWQHDDDDHWKCCDECGEAAEKIKHYFDEGEYITATCTTEGTVVYTCLVCGATVIKTEIPGHRLIMTHTDDDHCKQCSICGMQFDEGRHTYGSWVELAAPSDFELGTYTHSCSVCGYAETKMMENNPDGDNPHTGVYDRTFKLVLLCIVSGATIILARKNKI